jgi:glycine/D-amino acid oxidase-like deaminating enzyme
VYPSLLRRNRLRTVPVYDYVLATEPLTDAQLDRIGWRRRQGIGDCANQFHYYRLTMDNRIVWGGYDAVYHFGHRVNDRYEDRAATYRRLAAHFFITFPALEDARFTHRWAGAIDTNTRFCAHWGLARDGRVAYVNGFTGLGVGAARFAADVALISSKVSPHRAPNWRWCESGRCRFRPSRWPASVSRRRGGRWIAPTTRPGGETSFFARWTRWGSDSIPESYCPRRQR